MSIEISEITAADYREIVARLMADLERRDEMQRATDRLVAEQEAELTRLRWWFNLVAWLATVAGVALAVCLATGE